MSIVLNKEQAKGLSNFFFDMAKGLILGGFGSFAVLGWQASILIVFINSYLSYRCVIIALEILKNK